MESEDSLPIILVSATDISTADKFISELIDEEEVMPSESGGSAGAGARQLRLWQLRNKYYSARVALAALPSDAPPPPAMSSRIDAHLVLLAPHETESGVWVDQRVAALGAAAAAAARVRLAVAQCADERGAWAAAARALRYEPVPLLAPAGGARGSDAEEEAEAEAGPRGLQRAREALHAHTWRSLRLHADGPPAPHHPGSSSDSRSSGGEEEEEEEWSEWQSAEVTQRRADQFAAALAALAGGGGGAARGEARLLRAEALLAALASPGPPRPPRPPRPPP